VANGNSGNGTKTRCAVYTRKSTDEGLTQDFNSLDAQRDAGGYTGANMERPALRRLLADVKAGKVDCVVVYKVDRLTRSPFDFARIVEVLDKQGVSFVAVTQQFNTMTSLGRLPSTTNCGSTPARSARCGCTGRSSGSMSSAIPKSSSTSRSTPWRR
jgi:hypothetical protein